MTDPSIFQQQNRIKWLKTSVGSFSFEIKEANLSDKAFKNLLEKLG